MKPFHPIPGSTVQRTVTTTSANIAIPTIALGATSMRIVFTAGTAAVRVRSGVGSGTTAVTLTDVLLPNAGTPWNRDEVLSINANDTYVAAITDAGTATIDITFGFGGQ